MSGTTPPDSGLARPEVFLCKNYVSAEQLLEQQIEAAKQRMCEAPDRADKIAAWHEMAKLIDQRTPHRVRFMERMRGIV
jgi:hypothetical protein